MFSCKNVHEDSSDLVSVQVTDFRGSTNWIWLDVSSIFLEPRPLPVQKKAEHQASHLHLEDTLCVIQDTCILDQVKLIGFASTLVIQVSFGNVTNKAIFYPLLSIFWCYWVASLDVVECLFGEINFDIDALNHYDPFHSNEIILCSLSLSGNINALNNLLDHKAHLEWLKLVTVVHANSHESRLGHSDDQGCQEKDVD